MGLQCSTGTVIIMSFIYKTVTICHLLLLYHVYLAFKTVTGRGTRLKGIFSKCGVDGWPVLSKGTKYCMKRRMHILQEEYQIQTRILCKLRIDMALASMSILSLSALLSAYSPAT
jgi:hypothetical protein